jgi:hypothetical protein
MSETTLKETLLPMLNALLDETFESVQGIYLDGGTSLFETLAGISAEQASIPVSEKCASIAAQVKHVNFYLEVLERYMLENDNSRADWGEVWRTTREVTPEEWQTIVETLKTTYRRIRKRLAALEVWSAERPLEGVLAIITHTAYHLGEIRQATCVVCK